MLHIGRSFDPFERIKEMVRNLREMEGNSHELEDSEFADCEFVTPVSVLPLACMAHQSGSRVKGCSSYLQAMGFPNGTEISDISLPYWKTKTYIPITRADLDGLDPNSKERKLRKLTSTFAALLQGTIIGDQEFVDRIGRNASFLLISEMVDNILEHSSAPNSFIFSQYWNRKDSCEICLADNGIGVYESLVEAGRDVDSHEESIKEVIKNCLSSKDEYGSQKRGTGIKNTIRLLSNSKLNGHFCIISGDFGYYVDSRGRSTFFQMRSFSWSGTIVDMGFKKPTEEVDIYEFIR